MRADTNRGKKYIAVIEIKASETPRRLPRFRWALGEASNAEMLHDGSFPSYLLYGSMYTSLKLHYRRGAPVLEAEPWQFFFQAFNPNHQTAPFMYRMCQFAIHYWNLVA